MMNQILKLTFSATLIVVFTSCGNTKSKEENTTSNLSSSATKILASCNKLSKTDLSLSTATYLDQMGQVDTNFLRLKMNYLSSNLTAAGNKIRFFKWRVDQNGVTQMDQNPLPIYSHLANGSVNPQPVSEIAAASFSPTSSYYLALNDTQIMSQVIKVVVYSSTNAVVTHYDTLIPQFYAKTSDYQYNSDSTLRAASLQSLHPLNGVSTSGWDDASYTNHFQAFCF